MSAIAVLVSTYLLAWSPSASDRALTMLQVPTVRGADTSLYEFMNGERRFRQHGDTVWQFTPRGAMRVFESGERIELSRLRDGAWETVTLAIRGSQAYRLVGKDSTGVQLSWLRSIRQLIDSHRRVDSLLQRLPP